MGTHACCWLSCGACLFVCVPSARVATYVSTHILTNTCPFSVGVMCWYAHVNFLHVYLVYLVCVCVPVLWSALHAAPHAPFLVGSGSQSRHGCLPSLTQSSSRKQTLMHLSTVSSQPPGSACSAGLDHWKPSTCFSSWPLSDLRRSSLASSKSESVLLVAHWQWVV